uniref:Uncharacterized protein n=1 Tax=Arundo donax TaxID=35708 RepID=A0A0A9SSH8_ARUDO
MFPMEAQP